MGTKGVETLDINTMLQSVNNWTVDRAHYLSINPQSQTMTGEFGPSTADKIIGKICSWRKNL